MRFNIEKPKLQKGLSYVLQTSGNGFAENGFSSRGGENGV